jgi:uncharacterized YigZ family protein
MDNEARIVLLKGGTGEYEEKKSRFIATLKPVTSEEEATEFIASLKKKYWDARHNCSAYIIGKRGELTRCSDDGEPSGTAGRPMLEVLTGREVTNICAVVTRYFGGTLLGTGGLVRAYTQAVKEALDNSVLGKVSEGVELEVIIDYNDADKIRYLLSKKEQEIADAVYGADVTFKLKVRKSDADALENEITQTTAGRCLITKGDSCEIIERL